MNESFSDYFNRVVDEIHAMRKTSDERFERSCEEFDRRLAESRAEHQRWIEESNKRWEKADKQRAESAKQWAEHQRWMKAADKRWEESRAEYQERQRRMDERFEQSREEFNQSLAESRAEHQRWIDESNKRWAEADKRWEESRAEHQRRMDEADKQRAESDKRWEESRAEHQRRMDEADKQRAEAAKQWAEHKRWMEAADKRWEESRAEHKRWMKQADKRWGDIANVQGEIAEDLFRRNAAATLHAHGIQVDEVHHHLKGPGTREYDVVAVNGSEAVVFEIKNKLRSDDATKFLGTQLPQFKTAFPQYEAYQVYGGIGALVMSREQEAEVAAMGLFVLTQGEDGTARLRKPKNPRVW